jgi:hypothetical protein
MKTYRITYLIGKLDASTCPPAIVPAIFPTFDGWPVTLSESECIVTVPEGTPEPLNLSPLIKIELLP